MFYLFAALLLVSAIGVVTIRNTVYAVLLLIFAFCNAAALLILIGAEYIAMIIVIVYVGAVAVLFLFVVMMLDLGITHTKRRIIATVPIALFLGILVFIEINWAMQQSKDYLEASVADEQQAHSVLTNTESIGMVLYTDYIFQFHLSGIILLVAMIGAIVLTMRHAKFVKRQNPFTQLMRKKSDTVELVDVPIRKGIRLL